MERRSGRDTFGPGKLAQALGITGSENGIDLTKRNGRLWIEEGQAVPNSLVTKGPRVGLYTVPEPWKSKPWRFLVREWRIVKSGIVNRVCLQMGEHLEIYKATE